MMSIELERLDLERDVAEAKAALASCADGPVVIDDIATTTFEEFEAALRRRSRAAP